MIPILFDPNAREYNNNGLGVLADAGYCTITEELNGAFELELQYPVNGIHYKDLSVDCQILAKPNESGNPQAFRIYSITKPMGGVVTVRAEHISYELSSVLVSPFSASSAYEAAFFIKSHSITENPFNFFVQTDESGAFVLNVPASARSILGGMDGSFLDVYGGEYEFDNYNVILRGMRGDDNGVVIAYAKNLTGVKCEEKSDGIVTGAVAYWTKETDGIVQTVYGELQEVETNLSYGRNVAVDCSSEFDFPPSQSSLNEYATLYVQDHKNVPYFSVSVEFVNLGDTEEYKQYKGLYRVGIGDTVTIRHPVYGIDVKARVVKTIFDSVREKYEKIVIGEASANITKTIAKQEKEIAKKVEQTALEKAVQAATNAITGFKGGYVVLDPPSQPQRLLIMDTPDKQTAVDVWQFNLNGFGHSSSGINGKYTTAITQDGQIVADFITTGTLNAANITVKNLSADSIVSGKLSSTGGNSYFDLTSGEFFSGDGQLNTKIKGSNIDFFASSAGGFVGGISPLASSTASAVSIYYNASNSFCEGVTVSSQNASGGFVNITRFSKDGVTAFVPIVCDKVKTREIYCDGGLLLNSQKTITIGKSAEPLDDILLFVNGGDAVVSGTLYAGDVAYISKREIKKNIRPNYAENALQKVVSIKTYEYDLKDESSHIKMGVMVDEAPEEIISSNGGGISLYSYCGLLANAIKELYEKLEKMGV